ncbi:MAG TPA: cation:proton antiporter [Polyangia bacterium]|nr:cation:proton antiporter [Polyangia bacterium]
MHGASGFLTDLAVVLGVAAVTTVLCQRLRQPVVLGYLIAGLIIGPHVPVPLVADSETVYTLAELGVILLMFSLGLEFHLRKLLRIGGTAGVIAVVQVSFMLWLGYLAGQALGWTRQESLYTGAAISISSTTIIAKAFAEQRVSGRLRDVVIGILIVEDLAAILLLALLTTVSSAGGLSAQAAGLEIAKLVAFLAGLLALGLLIVPRGIRTIARLGQPETTLVASIGLCFAVALLARWLGYSTALGAFLAGALVAESGEEHSIATLIEPVRDLFAAIFFVAVGMLLDPRLVYQHWAAVLVLTVVVVIGKVVGVASGAFLTGLGPRTSLQAGMSLAQIGEFSFIIAAQGLALGATREFLYPVAVSISALTTLMTPWLIRASGPLGAWVDRRLPGPLQTFVALYGSWVERLRAAPAAGTRRARLRRRFRMLVVDTACLAAVVIGASLAMDRLVTGLSARAGLLLARVAVIGGAAALALIFLIGIYRAVRALGLELAALALPSVAANVVDLAAAPRRVLVLALQLGLAVLALVPLVAVVQPFLQVHDGLLLVVVAALLALFAVVFWRRAADLQGHVRAGAQMIVEALAAQARRTGNGHAEPAGQLQKARELLPGLGEPVAVELSPYSEAAHKTLQELALRSLTGATVLAIQRGDRSLVVPRGEETLLPGDIVALAGTHDAIAAAAELLRPAEPPGTTDGHDGHDGHGGSPGGHRTSEPTDAPPPAIH